MLTREGYPTWPGGAQPKRKIFGHLAIVLVAFCQLELENNLFGTHFDMQYQVQNIARGTTDPGYWLFNLSYLSS